MSEEGRKEFSLDLKDNISPALEKIDGNLDKTDRKLEDNTQKQRDATLQAIQTVTSLSAVVGGINAVTSSLNTLNVGSEESRRTLMQFSAAIQLVVGTAQALKGAILVIQALNTALKGTAIMSVWATVCANPLLGIAAAGAAAGAAGFMIGAITSSSNNNTTNITYNSQPTEEVRKSATILNTGGYA